MEAGGSSVALRMCPGSGSPRQITEETAPRASMGDALAPMNLRLQRPFGEGGQALDAGPPGLTFIANALESLGRDGTPRPVAGADAAPGLESSSGALPVSCTTPPDPNPMSHSQIAFFFRSGFRRRAPRSRASGERGVSVAGVIIVLGSALIGCDLSPRGSHTEGALPPLPALRSLDFDLSLFEDREPAWDQGSTEAWETALDLIAYADTAYGAHLEIPILTLRAASESEPESQGSGWRWPFAVLEEGQSFTGQLQGRVMGAVYSWEMIVSAPDLDPPLSGYVAFDGFSGLGGGEWFVYDALGASSDQVLEVRWGVSEPESTIRVVPTWDAYMEYRRFGTGTRLRGLRHVTALDARDEFHIIWDAEIGAGRVWHGRISDFLCWDHDLLDEPC